MYDMLKELIKPELMVVVPVLYLLGVGIRKSVLVNNKDIPLILGGSGVILSTLYLVGTCECTSWKHALVMVFMGITQGILEAGASVYINQLFKQNKNCK